MSSPAPPPRSGAPAHSLAAVVLVAVTYVFFLLFAQFGFLQGMRVDGRSSAHIHQVLAAMAVAGVACSLLAPIPARRLGGMRAIAVGLLACALAGGGAAWQFRAGGNGRAPLILVALLTGVGLGFATVALAAALRQLANGRAVGLHAGAGTGLAYFFCNVPAVFGASPAAKAAIVATAAAIGAYVAWRIRDAVRPSEVARVAPLDRYVSRAGIACATAAFFALVWFDSAAFAWLQNSPVMRTRAWSEAAALWTNGGTHAVAALTAGLLLDRRLFGVVLAGALALLVAGANWFSAVGAAGAVAAPIYAAGVSFYSTALAAFAARAGEYANLPRALWRAAPVYAVAGWIGSTAGIGLAEQSGTLPRWAAPLAAAVLCVALLLAARFNAARVAREPSLPLPPGQVHHPR